MRTMTIAQCLDAARRKLEGAGIDDARLEAEVLYAHAAGIDRTHVLAEMQQAVDRAVEARFEAALARRLGHEPLAYITGRREFYGIDVACGPGALIPRPETELLVDLAAEELRRRGAGLRVVDVGTGSGAIAVAIAAAVREARVLAVDSSEEALAVARRSVDAAGVAGRVDLLIGDLLDGQGVFDAIIANLPYVSEGDWASLAPEIREHEPKGALVAGPRGTEAIERLLRQAPAHLAPGGLLAAEIGDTQAAALSEAARAAFPEAEVRVIKDLAGLDRVLAVRV
jgi:release factor glutamine methyltransferase